MWALVAVVVSMTGLASGAAVAASDEQPAVSQDGASAPGSAGAEPSTTTPGAASDGDGGASPSGPAAPQEAPSGTPEAPETSDGDDGDDGDDERGGEPGGGRVGPAAAAAAAESVVGIAKETSLEGAPAVPGSEFTYILTARCSGLTAGCINQSVTDVLPAGLDVTSLPSSTSTREVTYVAATRTLTVRFIEPLQEPVGAIGLNDGATRVLEIGMRVPANTPAPDGTTITNTATTVADNADQASAEADITVSVPRDVKPVATKSWNDGSAVAGSAEASQVVLGIRNASSSSVTVEELRVGDVTPSTYERFDLTGVEVERFPAGTDTARLLVCTAATPTCAAADQVAGPAAGGPGPVTLALPAGVDVEDVTGFSVVFTDAGGDALPFDSTGGSVRAGLVLRDTVRSTGAPLEPTQKLTTTNCAVPAAVDELGALTSGPAACDTYDVLPSTVLVDASKDYVADTDGDFSRENGEYAVVGEGSPVTATVRVQNKSAFPLQEIRVVEPDAGAPTGEFAKLDATLVRLRFPSGATSAHLVVSYADGSADLVTDRTAGATIDVARSGTRPSRIEVVYTGVDGAGQPSIAIDATAYLDVHGTLNSSVTAQDLPNGSSPGVVNCAQHSAKATTSNSTGTTSGSACKSLAVESPRSSGTGTKTVSQTQLPPGQPVDFGITLRNNGNVPLVDAVLSDPVTEADGTPRAAGNPFAIVRIVSAAVRKDTGVPAVALELFDPAAAGGAGAWVAYAGADTALLTRSTGVRAVVDGELAPTRAVFLDLVTTRRDGVPDGVTLSNCFAAGAVGWDGDPVCSPGLESAPASSAAAINKSIAPGRLVAPIPGVPRQTAQVRLTIANTGNMSARQLQLTDEDRDFFDAVDLGKVASVQFPLASDRVRIDVFDGTGWVSGTPVAKGASAFPLPAGVAAGDVQGVRATFTSASGGYDIRPCEGTPTPAGCTAVVVLDVHPRETLRSDPAQPVPEDLENTLVGGYETRLQAPGVLNPVAPVTADLVLAEGDPELDVDKTPDSAIVPGETAPFRLTVTNSGTADLPDVVVRDLLPPGLSFDETFAGNVGYRVVDVQVPAGTAQPPTPTFTTTAAPGGRVTGLRWGFDGWVMRPGATFTIEIQVKLAPGVTEGQVNTNLMGAISSADELACAPGTGTQSDGELGAGTWCTDTAAVTTKAGAAFEARKWVAGNDELGWFDNRAGNAVPVGAAGCPSLTEAGRTYTAFPCIALVNPGDRYDYLLRMVNSGTEPATTMRIIDRFPVQGDKGVVLTGTDRGTQWDHRPTLATAPVLIGSGTLTTSYAHSEAGVCTTDLAMTSACGAGAWADPFGPEAVAAQMRVAWSTPLAPGQGVSIAFSMNTPLDVERAADPTIAWNSFGHAETTLRGGGSTRVLPPTEPIQVGVALAYGTLRVEKELLANPGGLPVSDREFELAYSCSIDPVGNPAQTVAEGSLLVRPGESADVTGIPAGAECEVWEVDPFGGVTNHPQDDPAVVTIAPQLGVDPAPATVVTVTNSYPLAGLTVTKSVEGDADEYGLSTTYPVQVLCAMDGVTATGFPVTVDLVGDDTEVIDAPVGATCTATELDDGGATSSTVAPAAGVLVTAGSPQQLALTVTNTFEAGRLQVLKLLSGAGASLPDGPFEYEVACTFEGAPIAPVTVALERDGDLRELVADVPLVLPIGAECTVTETDDGGADVTPPPVTVTIVENAADNTVQATFTNEFSAGTVALAKALDGDGATEAYATEAEFTVDVTCALGDATRVLFSDAVRINGGERLELLDAQGDPVLLPLGTRCWAAESDAGGATATTIDAHSYDTGLVVAGGSPDDVQTMELEVTNTFALSSLVIDKVVDGAAAGYASDREFTVAVTCVLPQGESVTPLLTAEPHVVRAGTPVVVDDLPVGAQCWMAETDAGGATSTSVEFAGPAAPVVVAGQPRHAQVTNTFAAGELVVAKRVVGPGGPGPYSFALSCLTDEGEVALDPADAAFELSSGERRVVTVPLGATCTVEEQDAPSDAVVSFEDSDRRADGSVEVDPRASVTVVNTFAEDVDGAGGDTPDGDGGGLPATGGPARVLLVAGLVLVLAGALVLVSRRRRTSVRG
ncbi:DUF5979 domain-containing protein [Nocardioides sp. 1609]|uniref:DUF5979 domain-containing protein n=1 Tax=Nocardioides sp. 1609 TaxID=2508327 RepID=UPI00106F20B9|nr:DUF5979 domain-containing protein [Nocardioides sp. 1609]